MIQCQGLIVFGKFILMDINLTVGLEIVKLNSTSIFLAIQYTCSQLEIPENAVPGCFQYNLIKQKC